MKTLRLIALLGAAAMVSACATPQLTTRNAPFEPLPNAAPEAPPAGMRTLAAAPAPAGALDDVPQRPAVTAPRFRIADFSVRVPEELTVSEANLYYPIADIVWRGDLPGNRKQQVGQILSGSLAALRQNQSDEAGNGRRVNAEIVLKRFHSVTEKTRYTVGGVHSISFYLTLRDAKTGEVIVAPYKIKADLEAFGGRRAMASDRQGLTMKVRIAHHLQRVLASELAQPGSWEQTNRKLARAVDQI